MPNDTMKYIAVEQPTHWHEHTQTRTPCKSRLTELLADILVLGVFDISHLAQSRLSDTPISLAIGRVGKLSVGRSPRRSLDSGHS